MALCLNMEHPHQSTACRCARAHRWHFRDYALAPVAALVEELELEQDREQQAGAPKPRKFGGRRRRRRRAVPARGGQVEAVQRQATLPTICDAKTRASLSEFAPSGRRKKMLKLACSAELFMATWAAVWSGDIATMAGSVAGDRSRRREL